MLLAVSGFVALETRMHQLDLDLHLYCLINGGALFSWFSKHVNKTALHSVWGGLPRQQLQARGLGELRRRADCTVSGGGLPAGATSSAERASVDLENLAVARDAQRHGDPLQAVPHIERNPEGVHPCERKKLNDAALTTIMGSLVEGNAVGE